MPRVEHAPMPMWVEHAPMPMWVSSLPGSLPYSPQLPTMKHPGHRGTSRVGVECSVHSATLSHAIVQDTGEQTHSGTMTRGGSLVRHEGGVAWC